MKNNQLITTLCGHSMYVEVYEERREYFKSLLTKDGMDLADNLHPNKRPNNLFDYSFLISGNHDISKDIMMMFGKAGVKTTIQSLTGNYYIIGMKY